jgi:hypothetical protein
MRCAMLAMELTRPTGDYATDLPLCPNCGRPMSLIRSTPRSGGLPDLCVFKCGECGVWLSEGAGERPTV